MAVSGSCVRPQNKKFETKEGDSIVPFVSEFEVLSQAVVPTVLLPAGASVPLRHKGYFFQISRILGDGVVGDVALQIQFVTSTPFPIADNILFDLQDADGVTHVLTPNAQNQLTVTISAGKTVIIGVQPNFTNHSATGPLAVPFGVRGYATVELIPPTAAGIYQFGIAAESRAVFCKLQYVGGAPSPDFSDSDEVAYALPVTSTLMTLNR